MQRRIKFQVPFLSKELEGEVIQNHGDGWLEVSVWKKIIIAPGLHSRRQFKPFEKKEKTSFQVREEWLVR